MHVEHAYLAKITALKAIDCGGDDGQVELLRNYFGKPWPGHYTVSYMFHIICSYNVFI